MRFYKYLYTDESIKNIDKIKMRLKLHRGNPDVFVICISQGNDQLDIINASFFKQKIYRKYPPVIVGLSKSKEGAVSLVTKMIEESLAKTGNALIKDYLILKAKTKNFSIEN